MTDINRVISARQYITQEDGRTVDPFWFRFFEALAAQSAGSQQFSTQDVLLDLITEDNSEARSKANDVELLAWLSDA
jgi:hypothetical protein